MQSRSRVEDEDEGSENRPERLALYQAKAAAHEQLRTFQALDTVWLA